MTIARDFQIVRETVGPSNANARDFQIVRETVASATANVRNFQIMREVILSVPTSTTVKQPVLFAVT